MRVIGDVVISGTHLGHTGDSPFTLPDDASPSLAWTVAGRTGPEVASVVIEVPELGTVTPTFRDGWFLAWWPATGDDNYRIVGRDADGEEIAALDYDGVEQGFPCS